MKRMTWNDIEIGDRVRLTESDTWHLPGGRSYITYPAGSAGTVTMKGRDGLTKKPMARVRFDGLPGEPWFTFPTVPLVYTEEA